MLTIPVLDIVNGVVVRGVAGNRQQYRPIRSLLTESVDSEAKVQAQGSAEFITSFASGAGALASGFVFTMAGFHILSMIGIAAAGVMLAASFFRYRGARLAN